MLLGFAVFAVSAVLARQGREPFHTWFYVLAWWSYILIVDGWVYRHRGESLILGHPRRFLFLAVWSIPFWLFHELLNFRLDNWRYLSLPAEASFRWLGYALGFATVVPAILETADLADSAGLLKTVSIQPLPAGRRWVFISLGTAMIALPLLWPRLFFPLVWGAPLFVFDALNEKAGRESLLADWRLGQIRRLALLVIAGLMCGVLWEFWNTLAGAHWEYTLPGLDRVKIFEMPALGYLGFLPFAAGVYAASVWAVGVWERARTVSRAVLGLLAAVFSSAVLAGIDRFTRFQP